MHTEEKEISSAPSAHASFTSAVPVFRLFAFLIFNSTFLITANAQTWMTNSGAKIYVGAKGAVNVEGNILHDTASVLHNYGTVRTDVTKTYGMIELKTDSGQFQLTKWEIDSILFLEDGKFILNDNTLIVNNADTAAIQANYGKIIAEGSSRGKVQWHIGENTGKYSVPFGNDSLEDLSVIIEIDSAGIGVGSFEFGTYGTDTLHAPKPAEIQPYRYASADIDTYAAKIADRFWLLDAVDYETKPVANITLKYLNSEYGGTNEIVEDSLIASVLGNKCWKDWTKMEGTLNTSQKQIQLDSVTEYSVMILHEPVNWEVAGTDDHYNKPVSPAPQLVSSDTAYTFTFPEVAAKYWGNQIEWAFDSSFSGSQIEASPHDITVTVSPMADTMIWIRARDSTSGCISKAVTTAAFVDTMTPQEPPVDTFRRICTGTATTIDIPDSESGIRYYLRIIDAIIDSAMGNDTVLSLNTGAVDTSTIFNVFTRDTMSGDTATLDTFLVLLVVDPVDTPEFIEGDTFIYIYDSVCYFAAAKNAKEITYTIESGEADIDWETGCMSNISSDFTVKATATGLPGCGEETATLEVTITDIAAPMPPEPQYVVVDTAMVVDFTFDSLFAGSGGNQIEWAGNIEFEESAIAASPATIQFSLDAGKDTVIYIRSRHNKSGKVSRAVSGRARAAYKLLSAGLLDKSMWVYDVTRSDEFNYNPDPTFFTFPSHHADFGTKWALNYCFAGLPIPCTPSNCGNHLSLGNVPGAKEILNYGNYYGNSVDGSGGEVSFSGGVAHIKATRLPQPEYLSCGSECSSPCQFTHQSGTLVSLTEFNFKERGIYELRCKLPPEAAVGAWPAFWFFGYGTTVVPGGGTTEIDVFDNGWRTQSSRFGTLDYTRLYGNDKRGECGGEVTKRTPCVYTEDWHTYTLVTTPLNNNPTPTSEIVFFIDGKEIASSRIQNPAYPNDPNFPREMGFQGRAIIGVGVNSNDFYSAEMLVDYFRYYKPAVNNPPSGNPQDEPLFLQNIQNGVAKSHESPNANSIPTNNKKAYITNSGSYHQTVAIDGIKISTVDTGDDIKVFYKKYGRNTAYVASIDNIGKWVEHRLVDNGTYPGGGWIIEEPSVYDNLTPASGTLVYYEGYENELMYFKKTGQTWGVYPAYAYNNNLYPIENCRDYINVTNNGLVYYKGTDNHVWVWSPGYSNSKLTLNHPNGSGAFVINKSGTLMFYRDVGNNLRQLYLGLGTPSPPVLWGWTEIPTPVVNTHNVTDNLLLDEVNSRIYFIGSDHAIYYYSWKFTSINPTGLTKLSTQNTDGHNNNSICEDYYNAAGELTLSHDKNTLYYRGTDYNLWYYFNDRESNVASRENWNKTPLEYGHLVSMIATESSVNGRLFYVGNGYDNFLYEVEWMNADNPIYCDLHPTLPVTDYEGNVFKDAETKEPRETQFIDVNPVFKDIVVTVHPNPSDNTFTFRIKDITGAGIEIIVSDITGKLVYYLMHSSDERNLEVVWNTKVLSKGTYFYTVKSSNGSSTTGKMVKM